MQPEDPSNQTADLESIGSAWMDEDGTITLMLRAEGPGITGDAVFTYRKDHSRYQSIIEHLGGLVPGENKSVPPWP